MDIKTIPKLDLHCHLDGSLTKAMMERHLGKTIPEDALTVSEDCTSLTEYLEKFDLPVQCLQDEAGLEDGAYTFVEEIAKEHVEYIEVRFAPMLSVHENLSCAKVIESVRKGMERAKADFQVQYGIIVCAMRNHSQEQNLSMLKCAREYLEHGVCALDLAGDESAFPTSEFRDIFVEAKRLGMPFTIHSGETGNLENVREAYELGARRIGHGIALRKDPELMQAYAKAGIGVEMCPTSNFQTKAAAGWEDYPLRQFVDAGIKVSINTDNRTVSGTTMTKELTKVYEQYGQDDELILTLLRNAAETAFDPDIKEILETKWKGI